MTAPSMWAVVEAQAVAANRWHWPDEPETPALGPGLAPVLAELVDDDLDDDDDECECCGPDGKHYHNICEHPCCPDGDLDDDFVLGAHDDPDDIAEATDPVVR